MVCVAISPSIKGPFTPMVSKLQPPPCGAGTIGGNSDNYRELPLLDAPFKLHIPVTLYLGTGGFACCSSAVIATTDQVCNYTCFIISARSDFPFRPYIPMNIQAPPQP